MFILEFSQKSANIVIHEFSITHSTPMNLCLITDIKPILWEIVNLWAYYFKRLYVIARSRHKVFHKENFHIAPFSNQKMQSRFFYCGFASFSKKHFFLVGGSIYQFVESFVRGTRECSFLRKITKVLLVGNSSTPPAEKTLS